MQSFIPAILVAALTASQTSAQIDNQDRYFWTAADYQTEFGRMNKNLRKKNRNLRVISDSMSVSMSMPELRRFELDFELSASMSMWNDRVQGKSSKRQISETMWYPAITVSVLAFTQILNANEVLLFMEHNGYVRSRDRFLGFHSLEYWVVARFM